MKQTYIVAASLTAYLGLRVDLAAAQTIVEIASTPEGCRVYLSGKEFIADGFNVHVRGASGYSRPARKMDEFFRHRLLL